MANKIISLNFDSIIKKRNGEDIIASIFKKHLQDKVYVIVYNLLDEIYAKFNLNSKQITNYIFDKLGGVRGNYAGLEYAESDLITDKLKELNVDLHYDGYMDVIISCKSAKINVVYVDDKEEEKINNPPSRFITNTHNIMAKTQQLEMFSEEKVFCFYAGDNFEEHKKELAKLVKLKALKRVTLKNFVTHINKMANKKILEFAGNKN